MSEDGGCEADVSARTKCGWLMFRECSELLHGRFRLKLKGAVYRSYVWPAIRHRSEAWCLKKSEMEILPWTERFMLRSMCGVQLNGRNRFIDLMLMLDLIETMDQFVMANSVH